MKTIHIEISDQVINIFRLIVFLLILGVLGYVGYQGYKLYNHYQSAITEHDGLVAQVKNLQYEKDTLTKSNNECFTEQDKDKAKLDALIMLQQKAQTNAQ